MNAPTNPAMMPTSKPCSCCGSAQPCSCNGGCQTGVMVRPRFFAGQLLTEDDLRSLEEYFLAKNRLHNRRLFGDGVVCGLEVLCHPCGGGTVVVQPGYALDCCGNDIVLSCKAELDINAMIRDLRQSKLGGYDCGDPCAPVTPPKGTKAAKAKPGDDTVREYCLYIHYCEQETEPVSPYSPDQPCTPSACEPSRIREGLRFELRCPEKPQPPDDFWAAIECCLKDVIGLESTTFNALVVGDLNSVWDQVQTGSQGKSAYDLRNQLLALIEQCPDLVSCNLRERILAVKLPGEKAGSKNESQSGAAAAGMVDRKAADELTIILVEILRDCICMAVIPPCRDCADTGVLLACLKVQNCEVIEICNLARHFVLSPAAMRYWLGVGRLEEWLHEICCTDIGCWPFAFRSAKVLEQGIQAEVHATPNENGNQGNPPTPPAGIGPAARLVQAAVLATEALQPRGSPDTARLKNIAEAFGILAGQPVVRKPVGSSPSIPDIAFPQLNEGIKPELALGQWAMDMVTTLQDQITVLQTKLTALQGEIEKPKRSQKPKTGGSDG